MFYIVLFAIVTNLFGSVNDWWSDKFTTNGLNGAVNCLVTLPDGSIVVGGGFTLAGSVTANHIARWDGTQWHNIGSGLGNTVYSLAVDSSGILYAGGYFIGNIAKWTGTSWQVMGSGFNGDVNAIVIQDGNTVIAGGEFDYSGSVAVGGVAKWTGTGWVQVGSMGFNDVRALALVGGTLYAGGGFFFPHGRFLAKLVGDSWQSIQYGTLRYLDNPVTSICDAGDGGIYVGGMFVKAGTTVTLNYVTKWTGTNWQALGSGLNHWVYSLTKGKDGYLYACGEFTQAAGSPASHIARWNGSAWSAIGDGLDHSGRKVLAVDEDIYTVGDFFHAGGKVSNHIAMFDKKK